MGNKARDYLMKFLALSGIFAFLYPVVLIARALLFKNDGGVRSLSFAFLLMVSGFLCGMFIIGNGPGSVSKLIFAYSTTVIPVAIALAIYPGKGIIAALFEAVPAFLFYFIGMRGNFLEFHSILSNKRIITGILLIVASLFAAAYLKDCIYLKPYIFISANVFIILSLVIKNQFNLEYNIFTRKYVNTTGVLKHIRSYNTMIIFFMFVLILALFNFKNTVMYLFNIAGMVLKKVIWLMFKLISLLSFSKTDEGMSSISGLPPGLAEGEGISSPLLEQVIRVLVFFFILYILYHLILVIIDKIKSLFSTIIRFIEKLFTLYKDSGYMEVTDYDDEIETIKPSPVKRGIIRVKSRKRNMKKNLSKIADPVEKVRSAYCIVLGMLVNKNIAIDRCDTTGEIYRKSLKIEGIINYFKKLTDTYEKVRYGDKIPETGEVAEAESAYSSIVKTVKEYNVPES